jgi:hypothetical protein
LSIIVSIYIMRCIWGKLVLVAAAIVAQSSPADAFANSWEQRERPAPTLLSARKQMTESGTKSSQKLSLSTTTTKAVEKNALYSLLATGRDQKPNRGNFFFNDEVSSHLYGYMYLVGFFFAQDPLFLLSFLLYSAVAAWATQESILPANPRVPAVTAVATLATTLIVRYGLGVELPVQDLIGDVYKGPTEYALVLECAICSLNILWGVFGTWQTKEQRDGATYGF